VREFNNKDAAMKTAVPLLAGLLIVGIGAFLLGRASVAVETPAEKVSYEVLQDYRECSARIPITRKRRPEARTAADVIAARNRAFALMGAEIDCGKASGIGGLSPSDIMGASGYAATGPLTRKLFPVSTP
jgi:hypothetical protein